MINDGEGIFESHESQAVFRGNIHEMALGDLDGDGDLDLAAAHSYSYGNNLSVATGNGDGDFVDDPWPLDVDGMPNSLALGDIDGDGDLDIGVSHPRVFHGPGPGTQLFLGRGDGTFGAGWSIRREYATGLFANQLDGSGAEELTLVMSDSQPRVTVMRGTTSETLPPVIWQISGGVVDDLLITEGDWDSNGILDSLANTPAGPVLRLNPGTDLAREITTGLRSGWQHAVLQDFNGDERTDLLAIDYRGVYFYPQGDDELPGEPIFTPADSVTLASGGIVDVNRDGMVDLMLSKGSGLSAWLGQGDGTFQSVDGAVIARGRDLHVADWDSDGGADVLVLAGTRLSILHGDDDGSFRETFHAPIDSNTRLERVFDIDGDGDLDVALQKLVPNGFSNIFVSRLLMNSGNGSLEELGGFAEIQGYSYMESDSERILVFYNGQTALAVYYANDDDPELTDILLTTPALRADRFDPATDLDQDGDLDLVLYRSTGAHIFLGSGSGDFTELAQADTFWFADWNNDGRPDLLTLKADNLRLLTQNAAGEFVESDHHTVSYGASIESVIDLNTDGLDDVVLVKGRLRWIFLNNGDATLTEFAKVNSYQLADLDRDGQMELFVENTSGDLTVYHIQNDGQFVQGPQTDLVSTGYSIHTIADMDEDGDLDVLLRHQSVSQYVKILLGAGDGTFPFMTTASDYEFADWNSDGNLDLMTIYRTDLKVYLADGQGGIRESHTQKVTSQSRD